MYMERTTTKIDTKVLDEVRKYAKANGLSVYWFLNEAAKEKLSNVKSGVVVKQRYFSSMNEFLGNAINGTRKNKRK